jgi:hypothetical protein
MMGPTYAGSDIHLRGRIMTDRISGPSKNPFGVPQTLERPTEGRVRASRTHARQQSRVDSGAVDFKSVEKKWSGEEMEKVHGLVKSLASQDADVSKIAAKLTKLCETSKGKDLSELFASKLRELKPETRAAIGSKLIWVAIEIKSPEAAKLVTAVQNAVEDLAKS